VLQLDLRNPEQVLTHRDLRWQIDLSKPVALLTIAVMHFIGDNDDPIGLMGAYGSHVAPGSYLVMSHGSGDREPEAAERIMALYSRTGSPMFFRSHADIKAIFGDFSLIEPGLVLPNDWHPELADGPLQDVGNISGYCGVGLKP
jgi:hypothetical protein